MVSPDWSPFRLAPEGTRPEPPRSIHTRDGIGDRLRSAAFAEIQAREAFLWADIRFADEAPEELVRTADIVVASPAELLELLRRL